MAALISANVHLLLAFLPPVLWLLFYLRTKTSLSAHVCWWYGISPPRNGH